MSQTIEEADEDFSPIAMLENALDGLEKDNDPLVRQQWLHCAKIRLAGLQADFRAMSAQNYSAIEIEAAGTRLNTAIQRLETFDQRSAANPAPHP